MKFYVQQVNNFRQYQKHISLKTDKWFRENNVLILVYFFWINLFGVSDATQLNMIDVLDKSSAGSFAAIKNNQ